MVTTGQLSSPKGQSYIWRCHFQLGARDRLSRGHNMRLVCFSAFHDCHDLYDVYDVYERKILEYWFPTIFTNLYCMEWGILWNLSRARTQTHFPTNDAGGFLITPDGYRICPTQHSVAVFPTLGHVGAFSEQCAFVPDFNISVSSPLQLTQRRCAILSAAQDGQGIRCGRR
jgi:hypothetical protein